MGTHFDAPPGETNASRCAHPAAHVHGLVGLGPNPGPAADRATVEWSRTDDVLRPGEQMNAAIGTCSSCGERVIAVATWNPADGTGERGRESVTAWVSFARVAS